MSEDRVSWRVATERALYGPDGFFRRHRPGAHFRTSVHASPLFAEAVARLARSASLRTVVDVGAGGGELLRTLRDVDPELTLVGVDLADRPVELPADVEWRDKLPAGLTALLVANEWLDDVPVDVVAMSAEGWRLVVVDPVTGAEHLGGELEERDLDWLEHWWPAGAVGDRAEVGWPRDEAWAAAVGTLRHGLAVAVDYAHVKDARPSGGSLAGYRAGRQVPPIPDGSCDLTSHVALDACAAAGVGAGATSTLLTTQRDALRALGVRGDHAVPPAAEPAAYLRALAERGEAAELTDPAGLGGFGWLVQAVGLEIPQSLTGTDA